MSIQSNKDRIVYLDYLRVLASFMIIIIHAVSDGWYASDVYSQDWEIYNCLDSISRWGVPIFVMISGVIFLNRNIGIRELYTKYIFRLVTAYFFWSTIYAFINYSNTTERFYAILKGPFHMWFIPMMIGLYISIPIMKTITGNIKITVYYILVSIIFVFLVPTLSMIISHLGGSIFSRIFSAFYDWFSKFDIKIVCGYMSYFILGYYLNKINLSKKQQILADVLGIIGFAATIILTKEASQRTGRHLENYYTNMTINVLLSTAGAFLWFKHRKYNNSKLNSLMHKLSAYSFCTYFIHVYIIKILTDFGIPAMIGSPFFSVLLTSVITFIISYIISAIINQIPFINKYIV